MAEVFRDPAAAAGDGAGIAKENQRWLKGRRLLPEQRGSNLDGAGVRQYDLTVPQLRRTRTALLVRSAALAVFLALIVPDAVVGDPAPQQWHLYEQPLSHEVRCFLSVDAAVWKHNGPAMVHIRLENLTDEDLDLAIAPSLFLTSAEDTYWSPADILRNKAFDIQHKQAPLKVHLDKHSSSDFNVDAASTKWAKEISCCWPSQSLGTVPPSRYSLWLELSDTAGKLVRSNEVTVLLEGKSDSEKK